MSLVSGRLLPGPLGRPRPSLAEPQLQSVLKLESSGPEKEGPPTAESGGWGGTELSNRKPNPPPPPAPFITLTRVKNNRLISLN